MHAEETKKPLKKRINWIRVIRDTYFWQRMSVFLAFTFVFYLVFWRFVSVVNPVFEAWLIGMMVLFAWTVFGVFRSPKVKFVTRKPMSPIWKRLIAIVLIFPVLFVADVAISSQIALAIKPYSAAEIAKQKADAIAEARAQKVRDAAAKAKREAEAAAAADKAAAEKAAAEEKAKKEAAQKRAEEIRKAAAEKAAADKAAADKAAAEEQARVDAANAAAKAAADKAAADAKAKVSAAKAAADKAAADKLKAKQDALNRALEAKRAREAKAKAERDRINALKSSKPLVYAVEYCGHEVFPAGGIEDYAEASEDGSTMFITTNSGDDPYGMLVLNCVANALDFSNPLRSSINHTNALMGTKTWVENKRNYEWSYHPAVGLNMSIVKQKECFLGFCN